LLHNNIKIAVVKLEIQSLVVVDMGQADVGVNLIRLASVKLQL